MQYIAHLNFRFGRTSVKQYSQKLSLLILFSALTLTLHTAQHANIQIQRYIYMSVNRKVNDFASDSVLDRSVGENLMCNGL